MRDCSPKRTSVVKGEQQFADVGSICVGAADASALSFAYHGGATPPHSNRSGFKGTPATVGTRFTATQKAGLLTPTDTQAQQMTAACDTGVTHTSEPAAHRSLGADAGAVRPASVGARYNAEARCRNPPPPPTP